jgi:hypothetical protein
MIEFFNLITDTVKQFIDGLAQFIAILTKIPETLQNAVTVMPPIFLVLILLIIPLIIILKLIGR